MKTIIKNLMPKKGLFFLKKVYWKLIQISSKTEFSKQTLDSLTALNCVVSYNKFGGYCIPKSSQYRPTAQKILNHGVHEPETIEYIRKNCGKGDIVHAGTYFGDFLPGIASACSPTAKVWAFEPNYESYRCANITILINDLSNVVLTNAGLGEKKERLLVQTHDDSGNSLGGASQIISDINTEKITHQPIDIATIDEAVPNERRISIIHLDIEGHEEFALKGALSAIRKSRPIIILEDLPDNALFTSLWFKQNILGLGYRMTQSLGKTTFRHGNKVFVHDER
jgi:FkbM family methyltransferase